MKNLLRKMRSLFHRHSGEDAFVQQQREERMELIAQRDDERRLLRMAKSEYIDKMMQNVTAEIRR